MDLSALVSISEPGDWQSGSILDRNREMFRLLLSNLIDLAKSQQITKNYKTREFCSRWTLDGTIPGSLQAKDCEGIRHLLAH